MADETKNLAQSRTKSPHHRVVYCNQVGTTTSSTEVRVRFGIIEYQDSEKQVVEDQVDVIIGPEMTVKLRDLLDRIISKHFVAVPIAAVNEKKAE